MVEVNNVGLFTDMALLLNWQQRLISNHYTKGAEKGRK